MYGRPMGYLKYGHEWKQDHALAIEMKCIQRGGTWMEGETKCGEGLFYHYRELWKLLWPDQDLNRWTDLILKSYCENDITAIMGCKNCVHGDTKILNPITGEQPTIRELCEKGIAPTVLTLNGVEQASVPFLKGRDTLYKVTCSDGSSFVSTAKHVVLSVHGFCHVESLQTSQELFSYSPILQESILERDPLTHASNARCSLKKAEDYMDDYHPVFHFDDAQLLLAREACQSFLPSPVYAQECARCNYEDGLVHKQKHIPFPAYAFPPSNLQPCLPNDVVETFFESHSSTETFLHVFDRSQPLGKLHSKCSPPLPFSKSVHDSFHSEMFFSYRYRVSRKTIVSIHKSHYGDFYDMTVPISAHYFAEGFIHHNSNKTYTISKIALSDYWCFPNNTLWMISTTEGRGAELRVWGDISELFNSARKRYPGLAGNPIDYKKTITTGVIDKDRVEARSLKKGLVVIPCGNGSNKGLGRMIGIKAPRLRHAGDEVPMMGEDFIDAYTNWHGGDFKGLMTGNFAETDDPLGIATEPVDGWDSFVDSGKTQEWTSKFFDTHVIALDGRDSPNFDFEDHEAVTHYPYLMTHKMLNGIAKTHGTNSWQWHSQGVGKPVKGMDIWRVFTKDFCIKHHAMEDVIWRGENPIQLCSLDPAYGGGDRCVFRHGELGFNTDGKQILYIHEPEIVPIDVGAGSLEPEEQIAMYVANRLKELGIPAQNCFYDSFGRGTLGYRFARILGTSVPVPVDSGGRPTKRPVRFDLMVKNQDGSQRHKRCDEHYIKFITELWFSLVEAIDAEQIRGMDLETIVEGSKRKFSKENNFTVLEPKDEMKKRTGGRSPDFCDAAALLIEGARQLGFKIENIGDAVEKTKSNKPNWLEIQGIEYEDMLKSRQLSERV